MSEGKHREFIIGLVALIALAAVIFLTLQIRGLPLLEGSYEIDVRFEEVAGTLTKGAAIFVYGVRVGEVTDIKIDPNAVLYPDHPVLVRMRIRSSVALHENAEVQVVESTLIGETTVVVTPGAPPDPELLDGMTILGMERLSILSDFQQVAPEIMLQIAESVTLVNEMLREMNREGMITGAVEDIASILDMLESALVGSGGGIDETLADAREFVAHLNSTLELFDETLLSMREEITTMRVELADAVNSVEAGAAESLGHANDLMLKLDSSAEILEITLSENAESWTQISQRADAISAQMERLFSGLESGEGTIGKLLTDDSLHREFADLIANINDWLQQVDSIVSGVDTPPEERSVPRLAPTEANTP